MKHLKNSFLLFVTFFFMGANYGLCTPIQWDTNNHYYELINATYNWTTDLEKVSSQKYLGLTGHLATITSAAENSFILNTFLKNQEFMAFIGGRDLGGLSHNPPSEDIGNWVWYDGPEEGTQFYQEDSSGGFTTAPYNYANWAPGQPNRTDIHYLAMSLTSGLWYDTNNSGRTGAPKDVSGYIVEYSTPVPEPTSVLLFGTGLLGIIGIAIRRIKQVQPLTTG